LSGTRCHPANDLISLVLPFPAYRVHQGKAQANLILVHPHILQRSPIRVELALRKSKRWAHRWKAITRIGTNHWPQSVEARKFGLDDLTAAGIMHLLKLIYGTTVGLLQQAWRLPRSVRLALEQRRRRFALNALETERLDRIRNPSRYLGK